MTALIVGAVVTVLAATAYGIVVSTWRFSYGFAAAAIGIAVGVSMRFLGRGIETKFSVMAAVYTITGCILGNTKRAMLTQFMPGVTSVLDVFQNSTFSELARRASLYVSLIDFVYWFVAVWFAAFLAKRPLSRAERLAIRIHEKGF